MRAARNVAIVALLALAVAVLPGGGDAARAILAALTLTFLALIAMMVYVIYRQNRLTYLGLADSQRAYLIAAVGALAFAAAGADEMLDSGLGTIAWIALVAGAGFAIFSVVRRSRAY